MTTAEKIQYKARKREEARDRMAAAVDELRSSDGWSRWVRTRAKFRKYSLNNQLLIALQRPDATHVAGFKTWLSLGRTVRKGEKSIAIMAPRTYKERDEDTGEIVRRVYFRSVPVFDIAQTDGDPLPEPPAHGEVTGDTHAHYLPVLTAFAQSIGWTVEFGDTGEAGGWARPSDKLIRLSDGADLAPNASVRTLVHELCHALGILYDGLGRDYAEVLTETAAYAVCQSIGLDTGACAVPYVAGWAEGTADGTDILRDMADLVDSTAKQIEDWCDANVSAGEEH